MIYFDCFQGASGDMLAGALLDLERDTASYKEELKKFNVKGVRAEISKAVSGSLSGTKVKFISNEGHSHRGINEIKLLIKKSALSEKIKKKILETYKLIFQAESEIHNKPVSRIKLHELSSLETLFEIASFFILLKNETVYSRMLILGSGIKKVAHGIIPVPAPATVMILKDLPVKLENRGMEMVTPTAAALLKVSADFSFPDMYIEKIGYGIGKRSMLRVFKGKQINTGGKDLIQIEVNIDDMTPEDISALAGGLLKISMEVYTVPAVMKKGRPGFVITVLCEENKFNDIKDKIFNESTTAGLRFWQVKRVCLPRTNIKFKSSFGTCGIKKLELTGGSQKIKPEYDDLVKLSKKTGLSISDLRDKIIKEYKDE